MDADGRGWMRPREVGRGGDAARPAASPSGIRSFTAGALPEMRILCPYTFPYPRFSLTGTGTGTGCAGPSSSSSVRKVARDHRLELLFGDELRAVRARLLR